MTKIHFISFRLRIKTNQEKEVWRKRWQPSFPSTVTVKPLKCCSFEPKQEVETKHFKLLFECNQTWSQTDGSNVSVQPELMRPTLQQRWWRSQQQLRWRRLLWLRRTPPESCVEHIQLKLSQHAEPSWIQPEVHFVNSEATSSPIREAFGKLKTAEVMLDVSYMQCYNGCFSTVKVDITRTFPPPVETTDCT